MEPKPEFKLVGAATYACTVCTNFKVEMNLKLNPGQLDRHLAARLEQHIVQYHSGAASEEE